jgi:DNA-binding SARP family transcriptional activator
MHILNSKLLPPQLFNTIPRERIAGRLSDLSQKKLVLISAGAGYGKTTFAAQALDRFGQVAVWYRLDPFDTDYMVFMTHLIHGLQKFFPGMGKDTLGKLSSAGSARAWEECLLDFVTDLENQVDRNICIVLDDFHLIQDRAVDLKPDVHGTMEFILARLPVNICFMIISRTQPCLKISTLRVRQQVIDINEQDLAFTPAETADFFSQVHGLALDKAVLKKVFKKTAGWAASLVLFSALKKTGGLEDQLLNIEGTRHHIFNYLEENVFEIQSCDLQEFMIKTSLFDVMEIEKCNIILGIENSPALFDRMIRDHLMVFPFDQAKRTYYYHHLFRDFLREKMLKKMSRQEINLVHLDIAALLEQEDDFKALYHYIKGQDYQAAVRMVEDVGLKIFLQGKNYFFQNCLAMIPGRIMAKNPGLMYAQARLDSYYGKPEQAIVSLKSAFKIFRQDNSREQMGKCLVELGAQYYYTGHVLEAKLLMEQVLDEIDTQSHAYIMVMTYLVFFCSVLGDIDRADAYEHRARDVIFDYSEFERKTATILINTSCTYKYYILGEFEKSRQMNEQLIAMIMPLELEACLPLTYYHSSATLFMLQDYEQGIEFAQKGICVSEKIHLLDSQKGWIYIAWAENCQGLARLDQALEFAQKGLKIFEVSGNRWGIANAYDLFARISLEKQDTATAKSWLAKAFDLIDGHGLELTQGILKVTMARALIHEENYQDALNHLIESRPRLKCAGYYLFLIWILESRCHAGLARNATAMAKTNSQAAAIKEKAWACLEQAIIISQKKQYHNFLVQEACDLMRLLKDFYTISSVKTYINSLLDKSEQNQQPWQQPFWGKSRLDKICSDKNCLSDIGLNIRLLGNFQVFAGNREIPARAWSSSKALMLFKYLGAHHSRGFISKDVLIELLWPDQDATKTGKRFNVAMSRVRKILEPDLLPRSASAYILRRQDRYCLVLGTKGSLDIQSFEDHVLAAQKNLVRDEQAFLFHCNAALALYSGPFLEENLYEDWCIRKREEFSCMYTKILSWMIEYYGDKKQYDRAIEYGQKFLDADSYDENTYRQMMVFYGEKHNYARIVQTFETCRTNLLKIDCPLGQETLDLFKRLMP